MADKKKGSRSKTPKNEAPDVPDAPDELAMRSRGGGGHGGGGHGGGGHGGGNSGGGNWGGGNWGGGLRLVAMRSGLDAPVVRPGRHLVSMGWHPDVPDFRDLNPRSDKIANILKKSKSGILGNTRVPAKVDNRRKCSPIEDQGRLGSCTAQAVVGLMEYMMRASGTDHIDGSRLFVYKVSRKLLGWQGDTGAYLRTSMQTVAAFGVPPEQHCPYDIDRFDEEPSSFLYSYADRFKALNYTRLDPAGASPDEVLGMVKRVLAANFCVVFGFTVYNSISHLPDIPFPDDDDSQSGGHAVMAVGFDDNHMAEYVDAETGNVKKVRVPSLIIRNSWGTSWGEDGYGYLPYEYVLAGLARDFWTSFKWEWLETAQFG
ncbi:C1 family peptidase [Thalassospiraceae bacterium LMO-JJ14]|nr:C1 family peptidase [Thalassospiraceae bacterium LMO-JJ14]